MAKLVKMAKTAAVEWHIIATNMVNLDVYAKIRFRGGFHDLCIDIKITHICGNIVPL